MAAMLVWSLIGVFATSQAAAAAHLVVQDEQAVELPTPCGLLGATFPGSVATIHDKRYNTSQKAYWSAQDADLHPDCRFYPRGAREIQEALADILIPYNVSIAVTSGGHSSNTGASNVDSGGVTIDLSRFNSISLVDNATAIVLGVAARWGDVYEKLWPLDLIVAGSRNTDDDVGSHILGGGISWFANELGWSCDSAVEFQIVTPQGQSLWTNAHWNEDIFWASKGTLGALGIVTQIKLPTFPDRRVFGGITTHAPKYAPFLFKALDNAVRHATVDPAQAAYISFNWSSAQQSWTYHAHLLNTRHQAHNPGLDEFMNIPSLQSTLITTTIIRSAVEIAEFTGSNPLRRSKFTLTATLSIKAMQSLHDLITSQLASSPTLTSSPRTHIRVIYQPLTLPHLNTMPYNADVFSLSLTSSAPSKPLLVLTVEVSWSDASLDTSAAEFTRTLYSTLHEYLEREESLYPFIYPPDASTPADAYPTAASSVVTHGKEEEKRQNPFTALPATTRKMLKVVREKYDPEGLWKRFVRGRWHVD